MNLRLAFVSLAALGLAACSTDMVALTKTPASPSFSKSVDGSSADGDYLVLTSGNAIDPSFEGRVKNLGGKIKTRHDAAGFAVVTGLTEATAAALATMPGVAEITPDVQISLDLPAEPIYADASGLGLALGKKVNPADAGLFSWQWDMRAIKADEAWARGAVGKPSVTVAILDTGIDYDDPDLAGLVDLSRSVSFMSTFVKATPTSPARPADDTVSKYFFPNRNPISDYNGHGTNVAAIVSSNAFAFAGVSQRTRLMGVKVLGSNGVGSLGTVLNGVLWAADHRADVANMSLGGGFHSTGNQAIIDIINQVFDYAKSKRMIVVVSAGNDGKDLDNNGDTYQTYCDAPHVICVSATGPRLATSDADEPAFYTNFGVTSIDVAAPGGNADAAHGFTSSNWPWGIDFASWVWSFCSKTWISSWTSANAPGTQPCAAGNRITAFIGTSQAAPHVSGLAALLITGNDPSRTTEIKRTIMETADDLGPAGPDRFYGAGRINVANATRHGDGDAGDQDSGSAPKQ